MPVSRRRVAAACTAALLTGAGVAIAVTADAAAPAFGYGTPAFVNSSPPSTVDTGLFANADFAGEPSIGTDWTTGAMLYQASNSTYKIVTGGTADAPTFTWSDVSSPDSQFNLDPILATNSATGTTMAGGDDGACGVMAVTRDDGGSWTPTLPCPVAPDHPTVAIGPFHQPLPLDTVGTEAAYYCQQPILSVAPDECSYSHNGGLSWLPSQPDGSGTCNGLFGHMKIAADGTAYFPDATCTDAAGKSVIGGLMTTDNGQTLSGYTIPGSATPPDGFDPSIAVDKGGRLYESWSAVQPNGDYHPMVSWSDDQGKTWTKPLDLAGTVPGGVGAATFEAAVAGDAAVVGGTPTGAGRAAIAYLASADPTNGHDPFASGYVGHWNLFVSYTYDGGASWQTVQATTDPVQIGEIDAGGTTTTGQRNLLDFIDASMTKDGRVVVAYADGCLPGCTTVAQSQDEYATIAYQATGTGLLASADTAAPAAAPSAPVLTATAGRNQVSLAWAAPSDGGSPLTAYTIYRGTSAGALTKLRTVDGGTSYIDGGLSGGTTYYYQVSARNAVGDGPPSATATAKPFGRP